MYKRRSTSFNKSQNLNRGSDIKAPNNTSLIVNRSQSNGSSEDSVTRSVAALLEGTEEDDSVLQRPSTSFMYSMSQKKQSTPQTSENRRILSESNARESVSLHTSRSRAQTKNSTVLPSSQSRTLSKNYLDETSIQQLCPFLKILKDCGAEEMLNEGSFTISEDQAKFSKKLNSLLKEGNNATEFLKSLESYMENTDKLKKLLIYTSTSPDCDEARGPVQDPLLRLLLMVDCLQEKLLSLLLYKMAEKIIDSPDGDDLSLISLILRQVRCLNRVENTKFGSRLFELIEVSPTDVKREIIFLLPEIVVEEEVEYTALQFVELLKAGSELTPAIIDSLNNLPLNTTLKEQVRIEVLRRLDKSPPAFLPGLTQFIVGSCETANMAQMILALREHLPFIPSRWEKIMAEFGSTDELKKQLDSYVTLTFNGFKLSVMANKHLADAWLKVIQNITTSNEFRPVDFVMLLMMHGYVLGKKPTVLALTKAKIRSGVLTEDHIRLSLKILKAVAIENNQETLELASALLKSFEQTIADMAIFMYIETFRQFSGYLRREVVCDIVPQILHGNISVVQNALDLLVSLRDSHKKDMEGFAFALITLLNKTPDLTLVQMRQLVDVLGSTIVSNSQEDLSLFDELQIFIRKKVAAWQSDTQKKGIVAAVMFLKHLAISGVHKDGDDSEFLMNLARGPIGSPGNRLGFFYDEFATMIRETEARPPLILKLRSEVLDILLKSVFVKDLDLSFDHFPMALQYAIDNADNLVLPIVGFFAKPSEINMSVVSAALRLMCCLEKTYSNISSMLCASVILPDLSVFDNFLTYQVQEQKIIMDCLFICANYFIECINAMSTQKVNEKLIIRLKQLVDVRKLIASHVGQVIDYVPPICQFHFNPSKPVFKKPVAEKKKAKKGKKRKSDGAEAAEEAPPTQMNLNSSVLPCTATAAPADAMAQLPTEPSDPTSLASYSGYFRVLNIRVYKLLRMELKLNPTKVFKKKKMSDLLVCDSSWSYRPEDKPELGPSDVLYLLQDCMSKCEEILKERQNPFLPKKQSYLVAEPIGQSTFLLGIVKLLPKLMNSLVIASNYCKDLQEANDEIWDAPGMFPKESVDIKLVFCAILKIISDVLAWRGFQSPTHRTILKDTLSTLARNSATSSNHSQNVSSIAVEAAKFLAELAKIVPLLSGGVSITRCVHVCLQYSSTPRDLSLVGDLCQMFLQRPWFGITGSLECGSSYNQQVDSILRTYFASVTDKLQAVYSTAEMAADEISSLTSKDSSMSTFKALTKANFPLLYRAICEALVSAASEELAVNKENDEACINVWSTVTSTLINLVEIAKVHTSRTNLSSLLKRSQSIIQMFLSKGLPVMESALRVQSDKVLKVLKSLQSVTRFLHNVCCHSKMTNDAVVAAHVPTIRSLCERLTLEVKGMLILNKIPLDCITIAVLKNRDIQGNDILSQSTTSTSDDESELPAEVEEEEEESEIPDFGE